MTIRNETHKLNTMAEEIAKGDPILRQPLAKHPQRWPSKLEALRGKVELMIQYLERGAIFDRPLMERAKNRIDKIAIQVPKKRFFQSEEQRNIEATQKMMDSILDPRCTVAAGKSVMQTT